MNNNLSVIRQEGFKALNRELGAVGTVIFIRQFENGYGDYTKEREAKLKDVTIDDIIESIQRRKSSNET